MRVQECQRRPVPTDLLRFSVEIELAHPVSQQGFGQLGFLCCNTIFLCRDHGAALWVHFCVATFLFVSRQRHFSVELKSVATKFSLSRQGWLFGVATQSFGVATGPGWLGVVATKHA